MLHWILFAVAGVIGLAVLVVLIDKIPLIHRDIAQLNLETYLDILLRRGLEGGFVVIRVAKDDPRFVQFRRRYEGHPGLELGFPKAPWSTKYFGDLKEALQRSLIPYYTKRMAEDGEEPVTEFLYVNTGEDPYAAGDLSRLILQEVFGLTEEDQVELYFRDVGAKEIWPG